MSAWPLVLKVAALLLVGYVGARALTAALGRVLEVRVGSAHARTLQRVAGYAIYVVLALTILRQLGFDLDVLLGAAGVLSVAVGFASQTAASNLISGLFLIVERPFVVGDVITVGATTGEVIAVDMLSVKLRTFDNLQVRVPNEALLKSQITNLSQFLIRRIDLKVSVAYRADLERARAVLMEVARLDPLLLDEPVPVFMCLAFGDSAIDLQFSVWVARANFLDAKTELHMAVKLAFQEAGIEIPFPQRVVTLATPAAMPIVPGGSSSTGSG